MSDSLEKRRIDPPLVDVCNALVNMLDEVSTSDYGTVMEAALPDLRVALKKYEQPAGPLTDLPLPSIEKPRAELSFSGMASGMGAFGVGQKTPSGVGREPEWKDSEVRWILSNPVYIGLGPYPPVIPPEMWVGAALKLIEDHGPKQFFANMLHALRESFPPEETDAESGH